MYQLIKKMEAQRGKIHLNARPLDDAPLILNKLKVIKLFCGHLTQ